LRSSGRLLEGGQKNLTVALNNKRTLFSFLRGKKKQDETSSSKSQAEGTHADLIWAEASRSFEQNKLSKVSRTTLGLKRSQLKQLKKATFLDTIELFKARSGSSRRGFNEFILAAMREMRAYEVEGDLEAYKALLSVLPRGGRLKAKSILHADVGGYMEQQATVVRLLLQLNTNHVIPDDDVGNTIVEVFGFRSYAMTHYRRMMYWLPKLRHANPWPVVERLPDDIEGEDAIKLAQLAAARICPDPSTEFSTIFVESKETDTPNCMVSGQSPAQRALLSAYATTLVSSPQSSVLYLDGPQFFWYRELQLAYYVLWGSLDKQRLKTQVEKCQEIEDRLKSVSDVASWDFSIPGSEREKLTPLQPVLPPDSLLPPPPQTVVPALTGHEEGSLITLQPKRSSLMRRGSTVTAERRRAMWAGFGPSHQITHLPENLTRHEQAEGTIMGVGVVAPMSNALETQARAYGGLTYKEMPDPTVSLPVPAPPGLIQQWLNRLQELNPALDRWTVIIRNRAHFSAAEEGK
uniref:ECSIT domain-containing protein n=1 Tax=Hydatigena taeniaeformis TaxID=6205 RepID=A0A0R3X7I5_HYDTA